MRGSYVLLRRGLRLGLYGFGVAIAVHDPVQRSEIVERAYEVGPIGGGVLGR